MGRRLPPLRDWSDDVLWIVWGVSLTVVVAVLSWFWMRT